MDATSTDSMPAGRPSTLIGRAAEMRLLERALVAAFDGAGSAVLLSGEAGVGKSRLVGELQGRALEHGFLVLRGATFEHDSAFPYASIVDALRAQFARRSIPELELLLGPLGGEIAKVVPELTLLRPDLRPTPPLDPEAEKRRLFESLIRFFLGIAARQPVLLALEDLHWGDDLTFEFLRLFVRRIREHRILLLASYRREEVPPTLTALLAQLDRERSATEIGIGRLPRSGADEMVQAILGARDPLRSELLEPLYRLTEGNPFAIEEVLKSMIDTGHLGTEAGRWVIRRVGETQIPRSVRDAVQRRTERLAAADRQVLRFAAVAGRRFEFELLRMLTDLTESELLESLKRMVHGQLVIEESAETFAFRHALTREAVYAMLLHRERQGLHRRVGEALERTHAAEPDRKAADLGYHYHAAEEWAKALTYAKRAGELAWALHAPRAAVEHFNRAVDAADRLGSVVPPELLFARARAYETIGYFEAARADYDLAIGAATSAGDRRGEYEGLIGLGRLWASRDYMRTGENFRRALDLARELHDPVLLANGLNRLGNYQANVARPEEAIENHLEALQLIEPLDEPRARAETLDLIGMASQLNGDLGRARESFERAAALWLELGDPRGRAAALASIPLCAANYLHEVNLPAIGLREAVKAGEEGSRLAETIGWRAGEAYARLNVAMVLGPLGEYGRALEAARLALDGATEIEHRQWIAGAHTVLGTIHLDLLDLEAAGTHLEQGLELGRSMRSLIWADTARAFLALAYIEADRLDDAAALLDGTHAAAPMRTQTERLLGYARARLALAGDDPRAALGIADRLIANIPGRTSDSLVPRLWELRGAALAASGDSKSAGEALREALHGATAREQRSLEWRIRARLGVAYRGAGSRSEARTEFETARSLILRLAGAIPTGAAREAFVARATARLPRLRASSPLRAERMRFGGLTRRQRQVAILIARGLSNREIADEMVVGVRTVESHVTQILMKLEFSARAQVAAWVVEVGLLGE